MQNAVENMKCPFLRLIRMKAQCPLQLLEERVTPWGDAGRKSRRDMGSEKVQIMKGPLNALENVFWDAP